MSYRYSSIDIIVGFGMCAIVFGALFLFVATTGTFLVAAQPAIVEPLPGSASGMIWLQPALGRAIVDRTLLQRASDRITAQATLEWDQALLAHYSLQSMPGGPFGVVMDRAAAMPDEHAARVQGVMGQAIVNGTRRGVRSGMLGADFSLAGYNRTMIGNVERTGERMESAFAATWQPQLGRWIVDAGRDYAVRAAGVQERLGAAIIHVAQARTGIATTHPVAADHTHRPMSARTVSVVATPIAPARESTTPGAVRVKVTEDQASVPFHSGCRRQSLPTSAACRAMA